MPVVEVPSPDPPRPRRAIRRIEHGEERIDEVRSIHRRQPVDCLIAEGERTWPQTEQVLKCKIPLWGTTQPRQELVGLAHCGEGGQVGDLVKPRDGPLPNVDSAIGSEVRKCLKLLERRNGIDQVLVAHPACSVEQEVRGTIRLWSLVEQVLYPSYVVGEVSRRPRPQLPHWCSDVQHVRSPHPFSIP